MRTSPAQDKILDRMGGRLGERGGDSRRHRDAEAVTQSRHVLGDREHRSPGDPDLDHPAIVDQRCRSPRRRRGRARLAPPARTWVNGPAVRSRSNSCSGLVAWRSALRPCRSASMLGDDLGVEQLLEAVLAKELSQQSGVQRERGCFPLRQRNVAFVDEGTDVSEQQ